MEFIHRQQPVYKSHFFLFGPRGTGKSTWLKTVYKNALYIDLLDEQLFRQLSARPERLVELIAGYPAKKTIIIDELQRVPELLSTVHKKMEENSDLQFILTGSSARKLKQPQMNLLGGRAALIRMNPFTANELESRFDMDNALRFGLVPLVLSSENMKKTLDAYLSLYMREEIQMEGLTRNIGNFSRFLEIMSFSHGQLVNVNEIARECAIGRKTVENYITILEDLFLGYKLPVFSKKAKRMLIQHSKFYFFDTGVFYQLRPKGPLDKPEEINGAALEGLVFQNLKAWVDYTNNEIKLFFWRTKAGVEVDFVLYGKSCFYAIEVKNADSVRRKDLNGLRSFSHDYPQAKPIMLYRGTDRLIIDSIPCMSCVDFLKSLKPGSFPDKL